MELNFNIYIFCICGLSETGEILEMMTDTFTAETPEAAQNLCLEMAAVLFPKPKFASVRIDIQQRDRRKIRDKQKLEMLLIEGRTAFKKDAEELVFDWPEIIE